MLRRPCHIANLRLPGAVHLVGFSEKCRAGNPEVLGDSNPSPLNARSPRGSSSARWSWVASFTRGATLQEVESRLLELVEEGEVRAAEVVDLRPPGRTVHRRGRCTEARRDHAHHFRGNE